LPAIDKKISSCSILGGSKVKFAQSKTGVILTVDPKKLDPVVTTFVIQTK
jgi:hypothetical protein